MGKTYSCSQCFRHDFPTAAAVSRHIAMSSSCRQAREEALQNLIRTRSDHLASTSINEGTTAGRDEDHADEDIPMDSGHDGDFNEGVQEGEDIDACAPLSPQHDVQVTTALEEEEDIPSVPSQLSFRPFAMTRF